MAANPVQIAYDNVDAYRRAIEALAHVDAALRLIPDHSAEWDASGSPIDTISDALGHVQERIDLLRGWIAVHVREAA